MQWSPRRVPAEIIILADQYAVETLLVKIANEQINFGLIMAISIASIAAVVFVAGAYGIYKNIQRKKERLAVEDIHMSVHNLTQLE